MHLAPPLGCELLESKGHALFIFVIPVLSSVLGTKRDSKYSIEKPPEAWWLNYLCFVVRSIVCVCTWRLLCKHWELYVLKARVPNEVFQWNFQPEAAESFSNLICKCSWGIFHMNQLVWLDKPSLCSVWVSQRCSVCKFAGGWKEVHGSSR